MKSNDPAQWFELTYRCAAVCDFGNRLQDPSAMRCHHPQAGTAGAGVPLAYMRDKGRPCGPEASLISLGRKASDD